MEPKVPAAKVECRQADHQERVLGDSANHGPCTNERSVVTILGVVELPPYDKASECC